ncbi:phage tail assembly chaperone [Pararhizobium sp. BT-229]|uniref:rcc01693 family protein n=1 Tax=Pararhizobium sp. BT-229 TaxID=2986923 RepID=UPI0021F71FE1|nr:rcc01693 family protein [Pararhizobium sp. BT-229]MCV9963462.1 phage tail assembly chaperone [Pararhizobium sp. BT-229]
MRAAAGEGVQEPFPWGAAMHAGLCLLRLPQRDFWAMTPRELWAAMGGSRPRGPVPERAGLEALMGAFPDGEAVGSSQ